MLYLVATPIGNLADITLRALDILKSSDIILCEDTRHSAGLLAHYDIHTPLRSYHQFNELSTLDSLLAILHEGKQIALISDAGTPALCDPGYLLVKRCREENVPVFSVPGPCAAIAALTSSGLPTDRFQFVGFLPKKNNLLQKTLIELLHYPGISVCYESPHRIIDTLQMLHSLQPEKPIIILRELTKYHEEYLKGPPSTLLTHFESHPPLGEIVLLFEGNEGNQESPLSPQEHVEQLQNDYNLSLQEAIKLAATLRQIPKRTLYNLIHRDE
jgi:16S rRNA (cytidine1402-2'-O)-methyltransferase